MPASCASSGDFADLAQPTVFTARLYELRRINWVVYASLLFGGPKQVLVYLGRYIYRVAIANGRLIALTDSKVSFSWKDYRHHSKTKAMTLGADQFIRRFLHTALPGRLPSHPLLRLPHQCRPASKACGSEPDLTLTELEQRISEGSSQVSKSCRTRRNLVRKG